LTISPISTAFNSNGVVQDFQENYDDEVDEELMKSTDEAKNEPLLGGHLSPKLNLFDQILP
jgi:hypothetical protein